MQTKSAAQTGKKWARVCPDRTSDYEDGVRNPRRDWGSETAAAEGNYEEGVRKAITNKSFGKGVKKCGTSGQQSACIEKGIPRWPEGIRMGEGNMTSGMEPVIKTLEATSLPPRYPKGDPRNLERVKVVCAALHKMKTGG